MDDEIADTVLCIGEDAYTIEDVLTNGEWPSDLIAFYLSTKHAEINGGTFVDAEAHLEANSTIFSCVRFNRLQAHIWLEASHKFGQVRLEEVILLFIVF